MVARRWKDHPAGQENTLGQLAFPTALGRRLLRPQGSSPPHFTDELKSLAGNSAQQTLIFSAIRNGMANGGNSAGKGGLRNNAALPHGGNQIVLAYDFIAVADEVMQQIKNLRLDRNTIFTAQHPAGRYREKNLRKCRSFRSPPLQLSSINIVRAISGNNQGHLNDPGISACYCLASFSMEEAML